MVTHVFDNSNLSQATFAIGAVICSLGHGRKHMLTILPTIWGPGFRCIFSEKATFQIIAGQNCQPKKPKARTKVDFLFERANILSEKPARKIDPKSQKKATF